MKSSKQIFNNRGKVKRRKTSTFAGDQHTNFRFRSVNRTMLTTTKFIA